MPFSSQLVGRSASLSVRAGTGAGRRAPCRSTNPRATASGHCAVGVKGFGGRLCGVAIAKRLHQRARRGTVVVTAYQTSTATLTRPSATETAPLLDFTVPYRVDFGQVIKVVGAGAAFGNWNSDDAMLLKWSEGDVWIGSAKIPAGTYEFKFIVYNADQRTVARWEEGPNRSLSIPATSGSMAVTCTWGNPAMATEIMPQKAGGGSSSSNGSSSSARPSYLPGPKPENSGVKVKSSPADLMDLMESAAFGGSAAPSSSKASSAGSVSSKAAAAAADSGSSSSSKPAASSSSKPAASSSSKPAKASKWASMFSDIDDEEDVPRAKAEKAAPKPAAAAPKTGGTSKFSSLKLEETNSVAGKGSSVAERYNALLRASEEASERWERASRELNAVTSNKPSSASSKDKASSDAGKEGASIAKKVASFESSLLKAVAAEKGSGSASEKAKEAAGKDAKDKAKGDGGAAPMAAAAATKKIAEAAAAAKKTWLELADELDVPIAKASSDKPQAADSKKPSSPLASASRFVSPLAALQQASGAQAAPTSTKPAGVRSPTNPAASNWRSSLGGSFSSVNMADVGPAAASAAAAMGAAALLASNSSSLAPVAKDGMKALNAVAGGVFNMQQAVQGSWEKLQEGYVKVTKVASTEVSKAKAQVEKTVPGLKKYEEDQAKAKKRAEMLWRQSQEVAKKPVGYASTVKPGPAATVKADPKAPNPAAAKAAAAASAAAAAANSAVAAPPPSGGSAAGGAGGQKMVGGNGPVNPQNARMGAEANAAAAQVLQDSGKPGAMCMCTCQWAPPTQAAQAQPAVAAAPASAPAVAAPKADVPRPAPPAGVKAEMATAPATAAMPKPAPKAATMD